MSQKKTKKDLPPAKSKMISGPAMLERIPLLIFIVYCAAVVYGVINHEPWRDEAQSWLMARDNSLASLFSIIPSEGHPPLWYLFIMPLAKSGMPYISQNFLAAFFMIAAVYLLLFKTSLPLLIKVLLPLSYVFFYEYSILARNYCLIGFFIAAIISLYPKRFERPWLFAITLIGLFNSHVLAYALSFGLLAMYIIDAVQYGRMSKQVVPAVITMCIGGLYLLPYMALSKPANMFEGMIGDHTGKMVDTITGGMLLDGNSVLAMILVLSIIVILTPRTKPLMLFIAGALGVLYIMGYKYNLGEARHYGVLFICAIGAYGISENYKDDQWNFIKAKKLDVAKYGSWLFALIILLQVPSTFSSYKNDIEMPFSDAKGAAEYLMDNGIQGSVIVGHQAWAVSAVLPYLPKGLKVFYPECERWGSYYINDSCFLKNKWDSPPESAVDVAYRNFKDTLGNVIFVFNSPLRERSMQFMDLLYHSPDIPIRKDEAFYIYRFKKVVKQSPQ